MTTSTWGCGAYFGETPSSAIYEGVSKSFRTESITKSTTTIINTRWEATQRVMEAKLTRLTHKIAIQLHLVAESYIIWSSRSRRTVRKLLDTPSYIDLTDCYTLCWLARCLFSYGSHPASSFSVRYVADAKYLHVLSGDWQYELRFLLPV
jgi:hypothetical protein